MNASEELEQVVGRLEKLAQRGDSDEIRDPLSAQQESAERVGMSASGSWLGYHALVYYDGLKRPPPDAHFDHQWGLMDAVGSRTRGSWRRYDYDTVVDAIEEVAGHQDFGAVNSFYRDAREQVDLCKSETLSILQTYTENDDRHLAAIGKKISEVKFVTPENVINKQLHLPITHLPTTPRQKIKEGKRLLTFFCWQKRSRCYGPKSLYRT